MFLKILFATALVTVANFAQAVDTNDLPGQELCAPWTSAIPQSMLPKTNNCNRISWAVDIGNDIFIEPYRFQPQSDNSIIAGGAVIRSTLHDLPGKPDVALHIGSREKPFPWNLAGPVLIMSLSIGYPIQSLGLEFGPHVTEIRDISGDQIVHTRSIGFFLKGEF